MVQQYGSMPPDVEVIGKEDDAAVTGDTAGTLSAKLRGINRLLAGFVGAGGAFINAVITQALPAGANIIGRVGIDQTVPGTTNAVVPAGNVANGAADAGNPVKTGGVYHAVAPVYVDGQRVDSQYDVNGDLKVTQATLLAGEDQVNNVLRVEQQFTALGRVTADGQIKAGAGFVHVLNVNPTTAAPTAGLLTVYDSLSETGTILHSEWVFAAGIAHTIVLDKPFGTGLYIGYDAALTNVSVDVTGR